MGTEALFIIDPQNDFCDPRGNLYVEGAAADIIRLSAHIKKMTSDIAEIFISLDSHDEAAIFHPSFWVDETGKHPAPFTQISAEDFATGTWGVSDENRPHVQQTFDVLRSRGNELLMVWPTHCVVSTWGHQIAEPLRGALSEWRTKTGRAVRYVFKGENPYTDQFSAFEGVDDTYPETAFNENLFEKLSAFDRVTFAGEALSHCVQESMLSYTRRLGATKQEVRLLGDCTSPVRGFDGSASLDRLRAAGVNIVLN